MSSSIYTDADRARVVGRLRSGESVAQIAARTGISPSTILVWARAAQVVPRRRAAVWPHVLRRDGCGHTVHRPQIFCARCRRALDAGHAVLAPAVTP